MKKNGLCDDFANLKFVRILRCSGSSHDFNYEFQRILSVKLFLKNLDNKIQLGQGVILYNYLKPQNLKPPSV